MDLQALNTFIYVAELNSFTRAGEKLGYSQPTVSFHIKQLESELGVQLFDRIGHTIKLTDAGRNALGYAQKICNMTQEMIICEDNDNVTGTVRIAMADSLCEPVIAHRFARIRNNNPGIGLQVQTAGTDKLFQLLDRNEADIVCTLDTHIYNTNYIILKEEKVDVNFVVSSQHPLANQKTVTLDEIETQPFLLTEKGMSYRRILDETLAMHSKEIVPVLEISSTDIIVKLTEQNLGVSFLPDYVTEKSVREGRLCRINVSGIEICVWKQILHHRDKWMSEAIKKISRELLV